MPKNVREANGDYKKLLIAGGISLGVFLLAILALSFAVRGETIGEGAGPMLARAMLFVGSFVCGIVACKRQSSGRLVTALISAIPLALMTAAITVAGNTGEGLIGALLLNIGVVALGSLASSLCRVKRKKRRSRR